MLKSRTTIAKLVSGDSRTRKGSRPAQGAERSERSEGGSSGAQPHDLRHSGNDTRRKQLARIALYTRLAAIAILILLVAVVGGVQYAERDQIRSGVHALGVDLSGMTEDEARAALTTATTARMSQPLHLRDGDRTWSLSASDLGLTIDAERALADAMSSGREGRDASRVALLWHLRSDPHEVGIGSVAVNGPLLDSQLGELESDIFQEKVDPLLVLEFDHAQYTPAVIGRRLDVQQTRDDILTALATGQAVVQLTIHETQPRAYDDDYATARTQLDAVLDTPIELVAADEVWTFLPQHIVNWMTVHQAEAGQPARIEINESWIDDVVWEISLDTDRNPQSARVWWDVGGSLIKTADGVAGQTLERDGSRQMILDAFLGRTSTDRVDLPVIITNPPALPSDLNSLGISSKIAEASTPYGGGLPERMHNIELAARLLNGVIVMPGQTFSFNAEIGEMTTDAGFQIGYGIAEENGELRTIPAEAGGICQVATTVFQPVFWSGYEIVQRGTHSYWIPGYASNGYVGLDAAVEPSVGLDLKWTNNSPTAVLIEASTDGQNFTVILYGTPPGWRVEVDPPAISNVVAAEQDTVYEPTTTIPNGSLRQIERAHDGFDVTVVRRVINGDQVETDSFSAKYGPSRNVVLVGTDATELPEGWSPPSQ